MHYFFYNEDQNELRSKICISKKSHNLLYHQIANVLKFKIGNDLCLLNNSDDIFIYEIQSIDKDKMDLKLKRKEKNKQNLERNINLVIANPKKDKLEWIVQKAVELGVNEITPLLTERAIKQNLNHERLMKINKEAVEQCHASRLSKINELQNLKDYLKKINPTDLNLILDTNASQNINTLKKEIKSSKKINLFIGPEGGFSPTELELLQKLKNKHNILLGERVLRLETAAILSMGLVIHYLSL